jgi:endoglucanase
MHLKSLLLRTLLTATVILAPASGLSGQTPVETHGRVRVEGNQIVGEHGRACPVMGMSHYWSVWGPQKITIKMLSDGWWRTGR